MKIGSAMQKFIRNIRIWSIWSLAGAGLIFVVLHYGQLLAGRTVPDSGSFILLRNSRDTQEKIISYTGTLESFGTIDVGTQVPGTNIEILLDYIPKVHKGQVQARLDPCFLEAALIEAEEDLREKEAELNLAHIEDIRNRPVYKKSFFEYLPVKTAEDAAMEAEAAVKRARTHLDSTTIKSPIDGSAIGRNVEAGQTITASPNSPALFLLRKICLVCR